MGWTGYIANRDWYTGRIDRKAECDKYFTEHGQFEVLKSAMVGTVYYAAVRKLKRFIDYEYDETKLYGHGAPIFEEASDEEKAKVFCAVFLTRVNGDEFLYKDMTEESGPYYTTCPAGILRLLTPTDSERANEWREKCWENIRKKNEVRRDPNTLGNLPVGSRITFPSPFTVPSCGIVKGEKIVLTKIQARNRKNPIWYDGVYRWKRTQIPMEYEVVKEAA